MKKIYPQFALSIVGTLTSSVAFAGAMAQVQTGAQSFYTNISGMAIELLFMLFGIAFSWKAITLVMKRAEIGELLMEMSKSIIAVGLYLFFIQKGDYFLSTIVESSKTMAATGAEIPISKLDPHAIMMLGVDLQDSMVKNFNAASGADSFLGAISNFFPAFMISIACLIILFAFAMISFNLFLTYCEMWLIIAVAPFMFALGGLPWTKDNVMKPFQSMLAVAVKIMILALIAKIAIDATPNWGVQLMDWKIDDWRPLWDVISQIAAVGILALLGPKLASAILAGGSSMSAGDALQAGGNMGSMATGGAAIGMGVAAAALGAATGGASLLAKAASAGARGLGQTVGNTLRGGSENSGVKASGEGGLSLPGMNKFSGGGGGGGNNPTPPEAIPSFGGPTENQPSGSNTSTSPASSEQSTGDTGSGGAEQTTGDASGAKVGGNNASAPATKTDMENAIKQAVSQTQGEKPGVMDHIARIPSFIPPDHMISGAAVSHVQD